MTSKPTARVIADHTRMLADGEVPLKLRVTWKAQRQYFSVLQDGKGLSFLFDIKHQPPDTYQCAMIKDGSNLFSAKLKSDKAVFPGSVFDEFMAHKHRQADRVELQNYIKAVEISAMDDIDSIISESSTFAFERFKERFTGKTKTVKGDAFRALENLILELSKEGRISTSFSYNCALRSFKLFHKQEELPFVEITPKWLSMYEGWMLDKGNRITTVGIYLRALRVIFNQEKADKIYLQNSYPFGKGKYTIPRGQNVKRALTKNDIQAIAEYSPKTHTEEFYRDLWCFSYYANGMNPKDIFLLKNQSVKENYMVFVRSKTKRSAGKEIIVPILPQIKEILDRWGSKNAKETDYVFSILQSGITPKQEYRAIQQAIKQMNKYMKRICNELEIDAQVTVMSARHSFATALRNYGVSVEEISESLGHTNIRTTANYLNSLDLKRKLEINSQAL